jgi:Fanconi anemia group J protein
MAEYSYKIGGCDVKFPHKAYGTQLSFMSKVIQALEQRHNALLEAPTGKLTQCLKSQSC